MHLHEVVVRGQLLGRGLETMLPAIDPGLIIRLFSIHSDLIFSKNAPEVLLARADIVIGPFGQSWPLGSHILQLAWSVKPDTVGVEVLGGKVILSEVKRSYLGHLVIESDQRFLRFEVVESV